MWQHPDGNRNFTDEPVSDSVEIMRTVDRMPPRWRELVREYGYVVVNELYQDGEDPDNAEMMLFDRREKMQLDYTKPLIDMEKLKRGFIHRG